MADPEGLRSRLPADLIRAGVTPGIEYLRGVPELIEPTVRLHAAWLEAHREWGPGPHEDGFGLGPADEVVSSAGFAAWVGRLGGRSRWIVEGDQVLGGIALRTGPGDYVRWAGHIGYGIRPSARRRGLGGWALARMLDQARERGMDRLLAVCATGNTASARTLERCGGVLESIRDDHRRYWFDLRAGTGAPDAG